MCEPMHYRIAYEINPWMRRSNRVVGPRALEQWRRLRERVLELGVALEQVEQAPETPDMTFTANAGVVIGKRFIPANFRFPGAAAGAGALHPLVPRAGLRGRDHPLPALLGGRGRRAAGRGADLRRLSLSHGVPRAGPPGGVAGRGAGAAGAGRRAPSTTSTPASRRWARAVRCTSPAGFTSQARARLAEHFDDLIAVDPYGVAALRLQRAGGGRARGDEHGLSDDGASPTGPRPRAGGDADWTSSSRRGAA